MLGNALIRGDLVRIDSPRTEDKPFYVRWLNDIDMMYNYEDATLTGLRVDKFDQMLERWHKGFRERNFMRFTIRRLGDDTPLGSVALHSVDMRNRSAGIAIYIGDTAERGKGYGVDALRVILKYGFLELNLHRIFLGVMEYNLPAIRTYEKVGFVHEGTCRQQVVRDGHYFDTHTMSILRPEWEVRYNLTSTS
jgi:RimJ/RimL family protein N-acetyltransferase